MITKCSRQWHPYHWFINEKKVYTSIGDWLSVRYWMKVPKGRYSCNCLGAFWLLNHSFWFVLQVVFRIYFFSSSIHSVCWYASSALNMQTWKQLLNLQTNICLLKKIHKTAASATCGCGCFCFLCDFLQPPSLTWLV